MFVSITVTLVSFLPLVYSLSGTLIFSGGTCSRHTAGTQHRIQTDIKSSGGESICDSLYPSSPHPCTATCLPFLFSSVSFSFFHSVKFYHSKSPPLIFLLTFLSCLFKNRANKKKNLFIDMFCLHLIWERSPLSFSQLVNALKTVAFLEVNLVDYKYK